MSDIVWGDEIAVNGNRPYWLVDGEDVKCFTTVWHSRFLIPSQIDWPIIQKIMLRADHPHYATLSHPTAPIPSEVGPEVVERMIAFVRGVADDGFAPHAFEASRIVALLEVTTVTKTVKVAPEQFAENAKSLPITLTDNQAATFRDVLQFVCARQGPFANEAEACLALLPEPVDPDEQYARDLIREQGWEGEQQIGAEAVVRMIAVAHRSKGE